MSAVKVKVSVVDKKITKAANKLFWGWNKAYVKVGVFGPKASEPVKERRDEGPAFLSVVELATIHEFGAGNVPERSFIRSYFDAKEGELRELMLKVFRKLLRKIVKEGRAATREELFKVLNQLGAHCAGHIAARIAAREIKQDLKPATIERKGSSTALIDTGQLRSSITYAVELK